MRMSIRVGLLLVGIFFLLNVLPAFPQSSSSRPEGWQGPWPGKQQGPKSAPQGGLPSPGSQRSTPSGKQVLELPSQPQSLPAPPRQQANIPPRPQPMEPRPAQLITVTVTDPQGRYVGGLQPEDFELYEDEEPQKITYFNTGDKEPISMGILIDTSGSMQTKISRARVALRRLIDAIRPRDEIFLEAFSSQPVLLQDFTDSRLLLTRAIGLLRPVGGTALYDAMLDGLHHISSGRNPKKALFIISDGDDTTSFNSLERAIGAARRAGVLIYAIGIHNNLGSGFGGLQIGPFALGGGFANEERGNRILREATSQTGGTLFTLNERDVMGSDSVLDAAVQTISRELRSQYSLGYTPTKSGSHYRKMRVAVRRAGAENLTVRTQQGYAVDSQEKVVESRRW
jgi:Ca-activated chloride channel family protein